VLLILQQGSLAGDETKMNITWRERVSEMAPELRQFECDSKWTAQKKHGFRVKKKNNFRGRLLITMLQVAIVTCLPSCVGEII